MLPENYQKNLKVLVLLEYVGIQPFFILIGLIWRSLNPCFVEICRDAKYIWEPLTATAKPVLILVLLEYVLHDLTTHGLYAATSKHFHVAEDKNSALNVRFIRQLEGYINFIGQVRGSEDNVYMKMKNSFDDLFSVDF